MKRDEIVRKGRMRIHSMEEEPLSSIPSSSLPQQNSATTTLRFQLIEQIGQGAIGQVFKAYDSTLKRIVALKFLRADRTGMEERFLREAQSQARVQHPNICKVYDVGEIGHKAFISMQYVNGTTLDQSANEMSLKQKVQIMKVVAEAVHAANKTGLIHRDLKPGNILVEKTEDGWHPYITDFGLAREIDAPELTRTGVVIGTPAYMAPEQARGAARNLDQRTDVYCLGATFYELLSGKRPFEGDSSLEVLLKVLQEEAPPLHAKVENIPEELETIVMKCLEKDPVHRYDSAHALSEDLARFLDDEPILACPPSWQYRLRKKAQKHRSIVGVAVLAISGVLLSAAFGIYSWWNAAEQAKLAQEFGQQVEKIEGFLRYVQTLPIHDIRPETAIVRERMENIEKQIAELGKPAEGPGHYALGRGYLALHEYENSLAHLKKAWKNNYRSPEVAYSLGTVFGELYQKQLETLQQISSSETRERRQKEVELKYRDPALRYLKAAKGVRVESTDYLEGLIEFYDKNYELALKEAQEAIQSKPWFYQSIKMEGDIHLAVGIEQSKTGHYQKAKDEYKKAGDAYKRAIEVGRSDQSLYEAECRRAVAIAELLKKETIPSDEILSSGIAACDQALQINKEKVEAYLNKAILYRIWGSALANYGKEAEPMFWKVVEMGEHALRWKPQSAEAHLMIGMGYLELSWEQYFDKKDTSKFLTKSIDSFNASVKINPDPESYNALCDAYHQKAMVEWGENIDPTKSLQKAISAGQKSVELDPSNSDLHTNLGIEYITVGSYQFKSGINPMTSYNSAKTRIERALQLNPKNVYSYVNLSVVYLAIAEFEVTQKLDPASTLHRCIEACKNANSINSEIPSTFVNMMGAYWLMASNMVEHNQDPAAPIKEAIKAYEEVIRLRGVSVSNYLLRAEMDLTASKWAILNGLPADGYFANAEATLENALKLDQSNAEVYESFARYYKLKAEQRIKLGKNAEVQVEKGIENAARSVAINAKRADAYGIQGELYYLKSRIALHDAERKIARDQANASLQKALELNPYLQYKYAQLIDAN